MSVKKQIGIRIKELRKMRGHSQEELAALADITAKHLSNMELGKENPTLDTFLKLASAFNVELWELLNYGHGLQRKELQSEINGILKTSKDDDLRLIMKFIKMKFINTIEN